MSNSFMMMDATSSRYHVERKRGTNRKRQSKWAGSSSLTSILPMFNKNGDDDEDMKYSKLPSGALYGGCYYPKPRSKRRRLSMVKVVIVSTVLVFVVCIGAVMMSYMGSEEFYDLDTMSNGIQLTPVETLKELERERIEQKYDYFVDGIPFKVQTGERLEQLRAMIPEWSLPIGEKDRRKGHVKTKSTKTLTESDRKLLSLDQMNTSQKCGKIDGTKSITLVFQGTIDRLWILEETCRRWKDPIIVVLYLKSKEENSIFESSGWEEACPQSTFIPFYEESNDLSQYPVNRMRNIGIKAVKTSHFIVLDLDFIPSETLRDTAHQYLEYVSDERDAMVIPAFEQNQKKCNSKEKCSLLLRDKPDFIPRTLIELTTCIKDNNCSVFQESINPAGHSTTNSNKWLQEEWFNSDGSPRSIGCISSSRYEPYVLLRWCDGSTPLYDERFHGYGKNKIEYIAHLLYLKYSFSVLPAGFIVHFPHEESNIKRTWIKNEKRIHEDNDRLYNKFLAQLKQRFKKPGLPHC